jgi:hypothetical protein
MTPARHRFQRPSEPKVKLQINARPREGHGSASSQPTEHRCKPRLSLAEGVVRRRSLT